MSRNAKINALLLFLVAALAVLPLALGLGEGKEEPFTGADAQAETAITELKPDYEPWFSPLYEPPSAEIESALFALQAALGAGVLAYYFGLRKGRRLAAAGSAGTGSPNASGETDAPTTGDPAGGTAGAAGAKGTPGAPEAPGAASTAEA
ncbi:energy-coupling factor ABC transporter substrate-binding protein [Streptomyces sp. NPDC059447]|uniref:energy-coupling factor ABC transporter substrate-binding protein n=1 Tax=Streptomyces sp. NPDC059447 TaxID=3346834 RepID=UPI0036A679DD